MRLTPALEAGDLGWALEVNFKAQHLGGGGACCFLLTHTAEVEMGGQWAGSHGWITVSVLTVPGVAAVSLEGRRVPTHPDGLPFGLRFAAVRVRHQRGSPVAFNARGQRIPTRGFTTLPKRHFFEGPYAPRRWRSPLQAPPPGVCELSVSALSGVSTQGGAVVPEVKGYRVLDSRAFQSCANTDYTLEGTPLTAAILLDAEHPASNPGRLPDMTRVRGEAVIFEAPSARGLEPGVPTGWQAVLTAERLPGAWLVVAGGASAAQRVELLRHLHATIHL